MKCEEAAEFVSALYDGERIPREAAEHLGACDDCRGRLNAYAGMAAELRRIASLDITVNKAGSWQKQEQTRSSWWHKITETMRIPRFAFALMLVAIFLLSGGLVLVRARPGSGGSVLWLVGKLPDGKTFHCPLATDGEPGSDACSNFGSVHHVGMLSVGVRFLRREGDRIALGVKTRYENPPPQFTGPSDERLNDVPEETVWVEPGAKQDVAVAGTDPIEMTGKFLDHKPPWFFTPEDTVDPQAQEFRIVSPVLIRDKEVVFNFAGASSTGVGPEANVVIYWPGEGRYLISSAPFKGAVQGTVDVSQVLFTLEGQAYTLLTGVPITRSEHVWIKREPEYRPSQRTPDRDDSNGFMGGERSSDFPR
jgi:predicted anti-sigma-YlaC factor YlaD